jgi:hypothetical protein
MKLPRVYPILDSELLERCGISMETAAAALLEGGPEKHPAPRPGAVE